MAVVLLVRHAQASFGSADYDVLSPLGEQQAAILGSRLAALPGIDRIVHGAMRRQTQTAALIAAALPSPEPEVVTDGRWDEYDHTDILGGSPIPPDLATAEDPRRAFQDHFDRAVARWTSGEHTQDYAEPYAAFTTRVADALDALVADLDRSQTAVVVTSGGVISAVCARLLGLDAAAWAQLNRVTVNTSVTKLVTGRRGTTLVSVNDHAHLEAEPGELLTYR